MLGVPKGIVMSVSTLNLCIDYTTKYFGLGHELSQLYNYNI